MTIFMNGALGAYAYSLQGLFTWQGEDESEVGNHQVLCVEQPDTTEVIPEYDSLPTPLRGGFLTPGSGIPCPLSLHPSDLSGTCKHRASL